MNLQPCFPLTQHSTIELLVQPMILNNLSRLSRVKTRRSSHRLRNGKIINFRRKISFGLKIKILKNYSVVFGGFLKIVKKYSGFLKLPCKLGRKYETPVETGTEIRTRRDFHETMLKRLSAPS